MSPLKSIREAYALLPVRMDSVEATLQLLVTQLQENPQRVPKQIGGPAVGDYQFEKGGGVKGVLTHSSCKATAVTVCAARGVSATADAVYIALQTDAILAAALARLLYYTDPKQLPEVGEVEEAWQLYLRTWRPGAYKRDPVGLRKKWSINYAKAMEVLRD